jgi:hypothetical protein
MFFAGMARNREKPAGALLDDSFSISESQGGGEIMDYKARCHCGRVRFSFRSLEIKTGCRCD